jgi:hypothetical protein
MNMNLCDQATLKSVVTDLMPPPVICDWARIE